MKLDRIDHIGVAVKNLDESVKFYEESIGLKAKGFEVVEEQKVKVAFMPCGDSELKGVRLIDQTPRYGAGGARIAFVHPKATGGVLLELCERK